MVTLGRVVATASMAATRPATVGLAPTRVAAAPRCGRIMVLDGAAVVALAAGTVAAASASASVAVPSTAAARPANRLVWCCNEASKMSLASSSLTLGSHSVPNQLRK